MGLYKSGIENKTMQGLIYLLLATLTHFSTIIYIPLLIIYLIFNKKPQNIKVYFLLSFIFLFLSKELLFDLISYLHLSETYMEKITAYLLKPDFIENAKATGNFNNLIKLFFDDLWYYLAGIYLIYNINKDNIFINLAMLVYSINNIFYVAPTIFHRFGLVSILFFILLLVHDQAIYKTGSIFRTIFFILLIINFIFNIIALSAPFQESYFKLDILTLPTIIAVDPISGKGPISRF